MSTIQTLINRTMRLNNTNSNNYLPTSAIEDINIRYNQFKRFVIDEVWEGFFWDVLPVDTTVVWQSEYWLPTTITDSNWNEDTIFKNVTHVESISIKYKNSDVDFIKARCVNRQTLDKDIGFYIVWQSFSDPFYFIADNSFFIFPAPREAVVWGIKIFWYKDLIDIEADTTYEEVFWWKISFEYYPIIFDLSEFIKREEWKNEEADKLEIQHKQRLFELINKIWNRKIWIQKRWLPNMSSLL